MESLIEKLEVSKEEANDLGLCREFERFEQARCVTKGVVHTGHNRYYDHTDTYLDHVNGYQDHVNHHWNEYHEHKK